jgi:peroxiredoxin
LTPLFETRLETTRGPMTVREMIPHDRPAVFISYPMDFTPTCTRQLCSYRDAWPQIADLACPWWGINRMPIRAHRKFKSRHGFPMDLISDREAVLLGALDLVGPLWVKRGWALVSPEGEILERRTVFPFLYPHIADIKAIVAPHLAPPNP